MKIRNLISLAVSFASTVSAVVITPSGYEVPKSLLEYLNCPIGDIICKNEKGTSCNSHSNVCQYGNPELLGELLKNDGHEIGKLTPEDYCKIHIEVCRMVMDYDPPLTKDYIFNLDQYLSCGKNDSVCQYGKNANCKAVLKLCWGNYSNAACKKLSETCDKIFPEEKNDSKSKKDKKKNSKDKAEKNKSPLTKDDKKEKNHSNKKKTTLTKKITLKNTSSDKKTKDKTKNGDNKKVDSRKGKSKNGNKKIKTVTKKIVKTITKKKH